MVKPAEFAFVINIYSFPAFIEVLWVFEKINTNLITKLAAFVCRKTLARQPYQSC